MTPPPPFPLRIAYINKLDKPAADVTMTLISMTRRLEAVPLVVQTPLGQGRNFFGLVDLVELRGLIWPSEGAADKGGGRFYRRLAAEEMRTSMTRAWEQALQVQYVLRMRGHGEIICVLVQRGTY